MYKPVHLSFWEQQSYFEGIDLLIIGGGIVGLNAALAVKNLQPALKVLVVDRGPFLPYGASTRNAGFACFGSMTELMDDLKREPEETVFALVRKRYEGLQRLRQLLGDEDIGYEEHGGYEVFREEEEDIFKECLQRREEFNTRLYEITGKTTVYTDASPRIRDFGFAGVHHMILNSGEGQLNTGMLMQALLKKVRAQQTEVLTGIEVKGWTTGSGSLLIETGNGFTLSADKILVTTNAFARQLLPEIDLEPGRAQVLITHPLKDLRLKGAFHYDRGYYYFRNVGNRVLFGGGRHLDFNTERTCDFGLTDIVQKKLEDLLRNMILPGHDFIIDQRWSGIMGLGSSKTTIIKECEPRVYCAVRMGGMGVAIGSLVGQEAAHLVCG